MSLFPYYSSPLERTFERISPFERMFDRTMSSFLRDMEDVQNVVPYWTGKRGLLNFGGEEIHSDDDHFGVSLDVSSFHPTELNVALDGKDIIIKGSHRENSEHSSISREFVRRYRLPEDVDPGNLHSRLDNEGKLTIEADRKHAVHDQPKQIPIEFKRKE